MSYVILAPDDVADGFERVARLLEDYVDDHVEVLTPGHLREPGAVTIAVDRRGTVDVEILASSGALRSDGGVRGVINFLAEPLAMWLGDVHPEDRLYVYEEMRATLVCVLGHLSPCVLNAARAGCVEPFPLHASAKIDPPPSGHCLLIGTRLLSRDGLDYECGGVSFSTDDSISRDDLVVEVLSEPPGSEECHLDGDPRLVPISDPTALLCYSGAAIGRLIKRVLDLHSGIARWGPGRS